MAGWRDLGNIWTTFKELDIRPIRDDAERPVVLAFVGAAGVGKSTLIAALRHDGRSHEKVITPTIESDLKAAARLGETDLIVLVLDSTRAEFPAEAELCAEWLQASRQVIVFYNKMDTVIEANALSATINQWSGARSAFGSANDPVSLATEFIPRVLDALPERHLSLARHWPLFRTAVARKLIADTSTSSAAYSFSTGLAEVIPALDIPFNVADVVILTKNQALMVYKLGLVLGLSTRWQDHVAEFGGVVGAGFLWRQVARQLVGLVPVWGILPKVAVAYAGTYALGEAIIRWYQTGHKVSGRGMRELYADALVQGRQVAQNLFERAPRPSLPQVKLPALPRPKGRIKVVCPNCGKKNPGDAKFCAYCATALA
ncbi:MAG TPA: zinc-ribbon domain-containing protein [Anaerolineae bacterium]